MLLCLGDARLRLVVLISCFRLRCVWDESHWGKIEVQQNSTYSDAGYPDRFGPSSKFVENSTKLARLEITGYRIKYSTVLRLVELQIRRGRKVYTQIHTVNNNSRTSNRKCIIFSKKNPIIRIFCISGWLAVPINPDKWSSTVLRQKSGPIPLRRSQITHGLS